MPDITMCSNHTCPLAKQCYRHEAKVTWPERQSWFFDLPEPRPSKASSNAIRQWECEYLIPMEDQ